jgi:hypothetical protein
VEGGNAFMDLWEFLPFRSYMATAVSEMKQSKIEPSMANNQAIKNVYLQINILKLLLPKM